MLKSDKMRILQAGNMANVGYITSTLLRKNGIEVDLLLDTENTCPEKYDPQLVNGYPTWFIQYHLNKPFWKFKILKIMSEKKYDLIHSYVELPIFSYLSGRRYIVQALGSDFRELAQSNSIRGKLLKRAYKKSKVILFSMPDHLPIYSKLNLNNGIFFPLPVNLSYYKPIKTKPKFSNDLVIFHPTSLIWRHKNNNFVIEGFSKFVRNNNDSMLIMIDRGEDSRKTKNLVKKFSLEKNVRFIKGPLNSSEMLEYYNSSDIVIDSFKFPSMSGITNEALCCEKPVITYYPHEEFEGAYAEHPPVCNASNSNEIYEQLVFLADNKTRKEIGKKGREWIMKYNNPDHYAKKLKVIYESVISNDKIDEIRRKLEIVTQTRKIS